jgi:hypothetical protein
MMEGLFRGNRCGKSRISETNPSDEERWVCLVEKSDGEERKSGVFGPVRALRAGNFGFVFGMRSRIDEDDEGITNGFVL